MATRHGELGLEPGRAYFVSDHDLRPIFTPPHTFAGSAMLAPATVGGFVVRDFAGVNSEWPIVFAGSLRDCLDFLALCLGPPPIMTTEES